MSRRLALGAAASLAGALAGGVAWGLIVKWTDYRIPAVAFLIGALAGGAALLGGHGVRGSRLQAAAVGSALLGIVLGKYLGYAWEAEEIGDRFGLDVVEIYSATMVRAFRDNLDYVFGWVDIIWTGLGVVAAWLLTREGRGTAEPSRG